MTVQSLQVDVPAPQGRQLPEPERGEGRQEHEHPVTRRDGVGDGEDLRHREDGPLGHVVAVRALDPAESGFGAGHYADDSFSNAGCPAS